MERVKDAIEEFKMISGQDDAASMARKQELMEWLAANKEGHEQEIEQLLDGWLDEMEADVEDIKKQALRKEMDEKVYKLTPWGYIAKEYFGKSASWLSQRINGTPVRGQVYTLNEEQKETLNRALSEVGEIIGSYRFT